MRRKSNCLIFFTLLLSFVLTGAVRADLVGWWRLDEGSGTTVMDSSASGNDGTFVGNPQWVAGKTGGALAFGGGDSVNVPGATDIQPESLTLMTWVSFDSVAGGRQDYLSKDDDYALSLHEGQADQKIHGIVTSAGGWSVVHGNTVVDTDTWYHTALTYDSSTQMLVLYLDGQVDGELSVPSGVEHRRGGLLTLGTFSGRDLQGKLDDIKIFDHAMSEVEIKGEMTGEGFPLAYGPSPVDGQLLEATWVTLTWRAGDFTVSHDVYIADNFDDVNDGTEAAFQGNQAGEMFIAGFPGYPFPDGLVPGTTYYWRIDEVNDSEPNSPWTGPIWSFFVPPRTAYAPSVSDGAVFIAPDVELGWMPGFAAKLHTVYFADNFDDVNNASGGVAQATTTFSPGALELEKTYYWRVDELDPPAVHKGDIWSFTTTLTGLGTAVAERWENITTTDLNTLKTDARFPNNPDATEDVTEFAWDGPDLNDYGGRISAWLYVPGTGDYTFWLNSDDNGELWLSTDDDPGNAKLIAQESSWSGLGTWGGGEEQSDPIPLIGGEKYYIEALWKEGGGGDHCQVAWQGPGVPEITVIAGTNLSPFEPLSAYGAKPSNHATGATLVPVLTWKPGLQAASHEVYFGTDEQAVADATKASP
ncbi:MAG: LamG-like jellyroll fold domain-containing protein, partial [Planctomycetota bacterium]